MLLQLLLVPLAQYIGGLMRVKGVLVEEDLRKQKKREMKSINIFVYSQKQWEEDINIYA